MFGVSELYEPRPVELLCVHEQDGADGSSFNVMTCFLPIQANKSPAGASYGYTPGASYHGVAS